MERLTEATRRRYARLAPVYDLLEGLVERSRYSAWRRLLWERVHGPRVLEVGVGTGKNMPYYPPGIQVTAIDLVPAMLEWARRRAAQLGIAPELLVMDVQHLTFPDASFDAAVATFVFCSVPDPIQGLREMGRVVKPGGQILLLEHMRAEKEWLGRLMDAINPLVVRVMGPNINRRTVQNVETASLKIINVEPLTTNGIFKLIEATPGAEMGSRGARVLGSERGRYKRWLRRAFW